MIGLKQSARSKISSAMQALRGPSATSKAAPTGWLSPDDLAG